MSLTILQIYSYLADEFKKSSGATPLSTDDKKKKVRREKETGGDIIVGAGAYCLNCGGKIDNPSLNFQYACRFCQAHNCFFACPGCFNIYAFLTASSTVCPACNSFYKISVCSHCRKINLNFSAVQKCNHCGEELSVHSMQHTKSVKFLIASQISIFLLLIERWPHIFSPDFFISEYYQLIDDSSFVKNSIENNWQYFHLNDRFEDIGKAIPEFLDESDLYILLFQTIKMLSSLPSITTDVIEFLKRLFGLSGIAENAFYGFFDDHFIRLESVLTEEHSVPQELKKYYYILGLAFNARLSDLKSRFRECAKKFHPDTYTGPDENEKKSLHLKFIACKEAYDVLSQFIKR